MLPVSWARAQALAVSLKASRPALFWVSTVPALTVVVHDGDQAAPLAPVHASVNNALLTGSVVTFTTAGVEALGAASIAVTV